MIALPIFTWPNSLRRRERATSCQLEKISRSPSRQRRLGTRQTIVAFMSRSDGAGFSRRGAMAAMELRGSHRRPIGATDITGPSKCPDSLAGSQSRNGFLVDDIPH